jgi:hypothetical protein
MLAYGAPPCPPQIAPYAPTDGSLPREGSCQAPKYTMFIDLVDIGPKCTMFIDLVDFGKVEEVDRHR